MLLYEINGGDYKLAMFGGKVNILTIFLDASSVISDEIANSHNGILQILGL